MVCLALLAGAVIAASDNNSPSKADASNTIELPEPRTHGGISVMRSLYLLADNAKGLPKGVYQNSAEGHNLIIVSQGRIDEHYNAASGFEESNIWK